ncbi:unnamed protein product, partial [marine sediment metagenome]
DLVVSNQIAREVKGMLEAPGINKVLDVAPRKRISVKVKMPAPLSAAKVTKVSIPVTIKEEDSKPLSSKVDFEGFLCRKTSIPKKIDGKENDWKDIPAIPLKNRWVNKKSGEKKGYPGDFEGSFKVAWDEDNLYLLVKITDDMFIHNKMKKRPTAGYRWKNDSLQIFIDTKCDARQRKYGRGYDDNDYDYAAFPDGVDKDSDSAVCPEGVSCKATLFRFRSPDVQHTLGTSAPPDDTIEPNIPSAFRRTADG